MFSILSNISSRMFSKQNLFQTTSAVALRLDAWILVFYGLDSTSANFEMMMVMVMRVVLVVTMVMIMNVEF